MGPCSIISGRCRATIVFGALYVLLCQAFLTVATPTMIADITGIMCASHDGSGDPEPDKPVAHDHQCCTALHVAANVPPPEPAFSVAWNVPRSARVAWRPEASVLKTGPPTRSQSARGPPSA